MSNNGSRATRSHSAMRVAFVAPSLGEAEGQGRVNLELVRRLLDHGVEVDLYTSRLPRGGVPGARVRMAPRPFGIELPNQIIFVLWATLNVTVRRYDVVHADGASLLSRADVVVAHLIHTVWRSVAARQGIAEEPGVRGAYHRASNRLNMALERRAYRRAKLVVANSGRTATDLVSAFGISSSKIRVMPLGVDSIRFRVPSPKERRGARERIGATDGEFVAVVVGAAEPRKGVPQAIEAFGGLEKARLIVIGDPRGDRARRLASRVGASVDFVVWPADPLPYYFAADAFVAPSPYEPFGLGVLEGMACGLPVVVTRTAGVAAICNGSALRIDPEPSSIRDAVETLQSMNEPDRVAMGLTGRTLAESRNWDATAAALIDAYDEVSA